MYVRSPSAHDTELDACFAARPYSGRPQGASDSEAMVFSQDQYENYLHTQRAAQAMQAHGTDISSCRDIRLKKLSATMASATARFDAAYQQHAVMRGAPSRESVRFGTRSATDSRSGSQTNPVAPSHGYCTSVQPLMIRPALTTSQLPRRTRPMEVLRVFPRIHISTCLAHIRIPAPLAAPPTPTHRKGCSAPSLE